MARPRLGDEERAQAARLSMGAYLRDLLPRTSPV